MKRTVTSLIRQAVDVGKSTFRHPEVKGLSQLLKTVKAESVMKQKNEQGVIVVRRTDTVFSAIAQMSNYNVGAALVQDTENPLTGIFTERDYLYKLILEGRNSKATKVEAVMTPNVVTASPNEDLDTCSSIMAKAGKRHIPICDLENEKVQKVYGILSAKDVLKFLVQSIEGKDFEILNETVAGVFDALARESSELCYVNQGAFVFDALATMRDHKVGALFVTKGQEICGIFTERDYLNNLILKGRSSKETKVKDVMNRNVQFIPPNTSVRECLSLMAKHGIQTVPVVPTIGYFIDDSTRNELVGMITSLDIIKFLETE